MINAKARLVVLLCIVFLLSTGCYVTQTEPEIELIYQELNLPKSYEKAKITIRVNASNLPDANCVDIVFPDSFQADLLNDSVLSSGESGGLDAQKGYEKTLELKINIKLKPENLQKVMENENIKIRYQYSNGDESEVVYPLSKASITFIQ